MEIPDLEEIIQLAAGGSRRVCAHSGQVQHGDIFVAAVDEAELACRYVSEAAANGAGIIISAHFPDQTALDDAATLIRSDNPRQVLGRLAAAVFRTNPLPVPLLGITGTNGKTTVSYLLEHILQAAGLKPGVLGTINYRWPGVSRPATLTTPGCWQLHEMLSRMVAAGSGSAVMEVSSHALDQQRTAGLLFDVAIFTNLSQDHLDYHKDMESYFQSKARLFTPEASKLRVINQDDPAGRRLLEMYPLSIAYGFAPLREWASMDNNMSLRGEIMANSQNGLKLRMFWRETSWEIEVPALYGRYNASNLLAAQAGALALGLSPECFVSLSDFHGVPGRLERISVPDRNIFVDFAHTPDALSNVLHALSEISFQKRIVVFGCGGNRDRSKRPLMGEAVAKLADVAVLTSDNPRDEDPMDIINDVLPGIRGAAKVIVEPDRRKAIALGLAECGQEDVLLVAGKGHEPYQEIKGVKYPYNDQQIILEQLGANDNR